MNNAKRPIEGAVLGFTFWLVVLFGTIFFFKRWLPPIASDRVELDHLFYTILVITGIAFVLVQGVTGFFIWRYSDPTLERAVYLKDHHTLEVTWTAVTAVILTALVIWGLALWRKFVLSSPPPGALVVEVTGQQFQWNVRYPGPDGKFGRTDAQLITGDTGGEAIGLDNRDPAAKDDVVIQDEIFLPVNKPVIVRLRARDVIHSFFLPSFRVKQDVVPGMTVETWFTPTQTGEDYEIACAQLCGLGHYKMRGMLHVVSQEEFNRKLKELRQAGSTSSNVSVKGE